jgi:hypothetical protein
MGREDESTVLPTFHACHGFDILIAVHGPWHSLDILIAICGSWHGLNFQVRVSAESRAQFNICIFGNSLAGIWIQMREPPYLWRQIPHSSTTAFGFSRVYDSKPIYPAMSQNPTVEANIWNAIKVTPSSQRSLTFLVEYGSGNGPGGNSSGADGRKGHEGRIRRRLGSQHHRPPTLPQDIRCHPSMPPWSPLLSGLSTGSQFRVRSHRVHRSPGPYTKVGDQASISRSSR